MIGTIATLYLSRRMTSVSYTSAKIPPLRPSTTMCVCLIPGLLPYVVHLPELLIRGTKEWQLIPCEYVHCLKNAIGGVPKSIESSDTEFPKLHIARENAITVTQYPGETIFVPSGWYHQVANHGFVPPFRIDKSPTLSLNHNWFNASCLERMYSSLCEQHTLSAEAIADLQDQVEEREFEELVQGLLKANHGLNWAEWWGLIEWNVETRNSDAWKENRMPEEEERKVVLTIIKDWLERKETEVLSDVRRRVVAFRESLQMN